MLDRDLSLMVARLAPPHEVRDNAPETFADLMLCRDRLVIWSGASDGTIWGPPAFNWAFRAWHDGHHLASERHTFDLDGETLACEAQCLELLRIADNAITRRWCHILRAEIIGQAEYLACTGAFPIDQYAFTTERLSQC